MFYQGRLYLIHNDNLPTLWIYSDSSRAIQISCKQCLSEGAVKVYNFNSLKDEISEVYLPTFPLNGQSVHFSQVVSYNDLYQGMKGLIS